jgi:hypothetical protein
VSRVDLDVSLPLLGNRILSQACVHWTGLNAGIAVNALVWVDVELGSLIVAGLAGRGMYAVNGANLYA